mmetsp:Transcript_23717/g.28543  ORF Transcript_23717/g.28543 Transcript_23717/m.28543 type:complete len:541 (+) Transcript_23717:3-1625(+)
MIHKTKLRSYFSDEFSEKAVEIETMLQARGIIEPTEIQRAACSSLRNGMSALLCAETGSGKSLAFLLPCLFRLIFFDDEEACIMVLAPTRELAVQLATEASALSKALFNQEDLIELVTAGAATSIGRLRRARCIVATPREWMQAFEGSRLATKLGSTRSIILDEIDALLPPAEKDYRSKRSKERARSKSGAKAGTLTAAERKKRQIQIDVNMRQYPAAHALRTLLKANPRCDLQLVGASATASRKTREALIAIAAAEDPYGRWAKQTAETNQYQVQHIELIRPISTQGGGIEIENNDTYMSDENFVLPTDSTATPRAVAVPSVVNHAFSHLEKKASVSVVAKNIVYLLKIIQPRSALVFLTEGSGYTIAKTSALVAELLQDDKRFKTSALHDRLFGFEDENDDILARTRRLADSRAQLADEFSAVGQDQYTAQSPVLFTFEATARGLHFDAVDLVLVVGLPKTPSSYLHLAGRAGRRRGTSQVPGTVVTLCPVPKAVSVLRSWSKQLGYVTFQPLLIEDVGLLQEDDTLSPQSPLLTTTF